MHRHQDRCDIVEVVAEYNILRGCIYDLAENHGLSLQGRAFHILNRVLDEAIGLAVQTFATQRALEVQRRREEYLAFVAHDLRNPLNAISLAARVLQPTFSGQGDSPKTAQMMKTLHRNVQRTHPRSPGRRPSLGRSPVPSQPRRSEESVTWNPPLNMGASAPLSVENQG